MTIKVYDADGKEQSLVWALDKYNPILKIVAKSRDHWEVVALHEQIGNASVTVRLIGPEIDDVPVAFYWPDAPFESLPEEPRPRHVAQLTDENGEVGFGMGGGAYYRPDQGEHGPHAVWVSEYPEITSDLVDGLGMIAKTNHAHLEPTFQFMVGGEESEPEPEEGRTFKVKLEGTLTLIETI
jgi:hypothetical protein